MSLKVELKPGERLIVGNCLITNADQRTRLFIDGKVPILREKDILTPATADTPAKRIYLAVQLMYLDDNIADLRGAYFELINDIVRAAPSCIGLVDEMKARLAGLLDERSYAPDDEIRTRFIVTSDIVERYVAERAFLPITAVGECDLVPAAVRPEAMHRVQHLHERHVPVQRQAVVRGDTRVALRKIMLRHIVLEHYFAAFAHVCPNELAGAAAQSSKQVQHRPFAVI